VRAAAKPPPPATTPAGYALSNGVYSQTFGGITVNVTLFTEVSGSGFAGYLTVVPTSAATAANATSVAASLAKIGLTQFSSYPSMNVSLNIPATVLGGVAYSQSF
jgi:hypothetical protein